MWCRESFEATEGTDGAFAEPFCGLPRRPDCWRSYEASADDPRAPKVMRLVLAMVVFLTATSTTVTEATDCSVSALSKAVDAIVAARDITMTYVEDAASDSSIVYEPPSYRSARAIVKPFLDCPSDATRVLISHLDDTRLTWARFKGGQHWETPSRVPIGYVCLDILLAIAGKRPVVFDATTENNDSLDAGVRREFFFRPDDYVFQGQGCRTKQRVKDAKGAWEKALRSGDLG